MSAQVTHVSQCLHVCLDKECWAHYRTIFSLLPRYSFAPFCQPNILLLSKEGSAFPIFEKKQVQHKFSNLLRRCRPHLYQINMDGISFIRSSSSWSYKHTFCRMLCSLHGVFIFIQFLVCWSHSFHSCGERGPIFRLSFDEITHMCFSFQLHKNRRTHIYLHRSPTVFPALCTSG